MLGFLTNLIGKLMTLVFFILEFKVTKFLIFSFSKIFQLQNHFYFRIGEFKMRGNSIDRYFALFIWKLNYSTDTQLKVMKMVLKKGMNAIDIGSNIGYYTLQLSKIVGKNGRVFSFEPEPRNFSTLIQNVEYNNCRNIIPYQFAISNKTGKSRLYLSKANMGDHRIWNAEEKRRSLEIKTVRIDDIIPKGTIINFVKMDIQGSEHLAILGMERLINENKSLKIVTEFAPYHMKKSGINPRYFLDKIRKNGIKISILNEKKGEPEEISYEDLIRLSKERRPYKYFNLYLESMNNITQ